MQIETRTKFDEKFFSDWVALSHSIYSPKSSIIESLSDLAQLLENPQDFSDQRWVAFSVYLEGKLVARALLTVSSRRPKLGKVGFLEFIKNPEAFGFLWQAIEGHARLFNLTELKGPINFHFFHSYRWKLSSMAKPFYGEPQQPDYYIPFFESVGMRKTKSWMTFKIPFFMSKKQYGEIRQAKEPQKKLFIRGIRLDAFDQEMKIIHGLFLESFKEMPEFEGISLESFKKLYGSFRYIISPRFAFIIEAEGKPIAFCINFMDPLPALLWAQRLQNILPASLVRVLAWLRIKLSFKRLLIMYVGRLPEAQEYRGIQSLVAKKMTIPVALSMPELVICYTAEDSPALKSYHEKQIKVLSTYGLWSKSLEAV